MKPVVLCILDGWGYRVDPAYNAVACAETPVYDDLWKNRQRSMIATSSEDVGLPLEQMGNSEVGHINIGAGRIVWQTLPRINKAISDGTFFQSQELLDFIEKVRQGGGACHIIGLMSDGGIHNHMDHMLESVQVCAQAGLDVKVHIFSDGRDAPQTSALRYLEEVERRIGHFPNVKLVTLGGRYYGMDRDNRWDRVQKAYDVFVDANGPRYGSVREAITAAYSQDVTDEFIIPCVINDYEGMQDGDGVFMTHFRADRAREIVAALVHPDFTSFERRFVNFSGQLGMISYGSELDLFLPVIFSPVLIKSGLGELVSQAGRKQLRVSETEKYPHVTYFFNGGSEDVYPGESRILIPSPRVATYDLQPEMSAFEVTDEMVKAIHSQEFDLIVVNYANGDMVGHTGNFEAAVKSVAIVDQCLGRLIEAVDQEGGVMLVTADHGNVELMRDLETGEPFTQHTNTPVPLIIAGEKAEGFSLKETGRLADLAPTVLYLMGIPQPTVMTGVNLIIDSAHQDVSV